MSLYNIINNLNFTNNNNDVDNMDRTQFYSSIKLISNYIKGETKNHILNIFDGHNIECTKKLSGGKSLEKLYLEFFGEKFLGAHDAI